MTMTPAEIPFRRIDHVRFFVGNARQSAYFYRNAFGFDVIAYAGLETRPAARGRLRAAPGGHHLRPGLAARTDHPESPSADAPRRRRAGHRPGGGRRRRGVRRGRRPRRPSASSPPDDRCEDEYGVYEFATIRAYGDTTHTLRQPRPLPGRLRARLSAARPRPLQPAAPSSRSASRPSTTSSATSRKAR